MNDEEITNLLKLIQTVDKSKVDEQVIIVWAEILKNVVYEDAVAAVIKHFHGSPYPIKPYHVVQGAQAVKQDRAHRWYRIGSLRWRELSGTSPDYWHPASSTHALAELGRLVETNDPTADQQIRNAIETAARMEAEIEAGRARNKMLTERAGD